MPTEQILALLIQERDKLNRAIEVLQGSAKRHGRPPKDPKTAAITATPRKRRPFSAATQEDGSGAKEALE